MATSSITHNFVISSKKDANKFVDIIDSPVLPHTPLARYQIISNPKDISATILELKKKYSER